MRPFPARVTPTLPIFPAKANILIDQSGHARLADFGLLSIISDPKYLLSSSSHTQGGTARWMSPERINPERFGSKDGRPTISADCYALGMVIYETVSGKLPFHRHADLTVITKVLEGERPPQGGRFTNSLWNMLEQCWTPQPNDRPSVEDVLQCLEMVSSLSEPPFPTADEGMDEDSNGWDSVSSSSGSNSLDSFAIDDRGNSLDSFATNNRGASFPSLCAEYLRILDSEIGLDPTQDAVQDAHQAVLHIFQAGRLCPVPHLTLQDSLTVVAVP